MCAGRAADAASRRRSRSAGRFFSRARLSFFGVGVQPPTADWGNYATRRDDDELEPWLGIFPGAFIFITVMCVQRARNGLTDRARASIAPPSEPCRSQ
jgi:ABC-type dipeptide/oligopeptide/nickel transport system permease subunit